MKNKYIFSFIVPFCAMYSMEIELNSLSKIPRIQLSLITHQKSAIEAIDDAINEKYQPTNSFFDILISPSLPEKDILSLLELVDKLCITTKTVFATIADNLYQKNNFFNKAINHCTQLACTNINNVTVDTLDIVNNYQERQPTEQLNNLPLLIKKYVMSRVWNGIKTNYQLRFKHPQRVYVYTLCPTRNILVAHCIDKHLHLWNFNTGQKIDTLAEEKYLGALSFNNDGSQLATAAYYNNNISLIKIWDITSKKIISTFTQEDFVYHIEFLKDTSQNTLVAFTETKGNKKILNLYTFDSNTKPTFSGTISSAEQSIDNCDSYKNYEINVDENDRSIALLTKKNCPALYLCKRALNNGVQTDACFIYKSETFSQLTEFEQKIIKKKSLQKKAITL